MEPVVGRVGRRSTRSDRVFLTGAFAAVRRREVQPAGTVERPT